MRTQLARWRGPRPGRSGILSCAGSRCEKLQEEGFNAEVAATLATLAPRPHAHNGGPEAIVALEVMYDYLDGVTEQPAPDPLRSGRQLFTAFTDALDRRAGLDEDYYRQHPADPTADTCGSSLRTVSETLACLPQAEALAATMQGAAAPLRGSGGADPRRCARQHLDSRAMGQRSDERLGPRLARVPRGRPSSVLAVHALIALAGDERTTAAHAAPIDEVYLALGALSTMLDSLVDHEQDAADGTLAYIDRYDDRSLLGERLVGSRPTRRHEGTRGAGQRASPDDDRPA